MSLTDRFVKYRVDDAAAVAVVDGVQSTEPQASNPALIKIRSGLKALKEGSNLS